MAVKLGLSPEQFNQLANIQEDCKGCPLSETQIVSASGVQYYDTYCREGHTPPCRKIIKRRGTKLH